MRWLRVAVLVVVGAAVGADAQDRDPVLAPLSQGRLVLWIVHPAAKGWTPDGAAGAATLGPQGISREIHEVTAGSFGTAASNVGQTAGSYGQTASTLGRNASDTGTAASNYGQTAGSYGTAASNVGQTAGSYGQTASSYGQTSSTYGESISGVPNSGPPNGSAARQTQGQSPLARLLVRGRTRDWDGVVNTLKSSFPGLDLVTYDVREEDLNDALRLAARTRDTPDVLVGAPLPWTWAKLVGGRKTSLVLAAFGAKSFSPQAQGRDQPVVASRFRWGPEWAVVANAPHLAAAEAFALWMADGDDCVLCRRAAPDATGAGVVALRAVNAVVQGGAPDGGDADPEIARASAEKVRAAIWGTEVSGVERLLVDGEVVKELGNDRFAAVAVRAMVSSQRTRGGGGTFGVVHALVLLRRESAVAKWKVLQITPDMTGSMLAGAMGDITESVDLAHEAKVQGVSLAAPPDGDTRGPRPDLWWDNRGGASLELVEWQRGSDASWSGSRLVFLPDRTGEVKTRVTAGFAAEAGAYRWRVWQVGDGGAVVLSPWRTMNIVP